LLDLTELFIAIEWVGIKYAVVFFQLSDKVRHLLTSKVCVTTSPYPGQLKYRQ